MITRYQYRTALMANWSYTFKSKADAIAHATAIAPNERIEVRTVLVR